MAEQIPYYAQWLGIPALTAQDIDLLKAASQYIVALIAFALVTVPATARAKVQFHIERSRLSQEITQAFETVYRQDGAVLTGSGDQIKEYDLLSVLNSGTSWLPAVPRNAAAPLLERGERYRPFVARSVAELTDARISIDHLQLVAGIFRRIGVGLDTGTLRRGDLNTMWNNVVVWTYAHRLDFLAQTLGVSRREFTRVIGSICRTYPIHVRNHRRPGKDYFDFLLSRRRYVLLTDIGCRARLRLHYVRFFRERRSVASRILLKGFDSAMRLVRLF